MYPTFLKSQLHLGVGTVTVLTMLLNAGAIVGGLSFGAWSEKIGRRRGMIIAALLALPSIPLWTHGGSLVLLGLGAFLIQVMVQGAWGIVPTYLNELSPNDVRGTLPGFAYQLGNLLAASTATAQSWLADRSGGNYALVMASWMAVVAVLLALLAWLGPEVRGVHFGQAAPDGIAGCKLRETHDESRQGQGGFSSLHATVANESDGLESQ